MKKYLFVLLGLLVFSATTVYAQELTEKEKERQEKEAKKQLIRVHKESINFCNTDIGFNRCPLYQKLFIFCTQLNNLGILFSGFL